MLDSEELHAAKREFRVEYVEQQTVEVAISRKWRDMVVSVRYLQDESEAVPTERIQSEALTIEARHEGLGKVTPCMYTHVHLLMCMACALHGYRRATRASARSRPRG